MAKSLIRINVVAQKLGGVHVSHAWRKIGADPKAPKPIRLSERHTVFDEAEVDAWVDRLVAEAKAKGKPAKSIGAQAHRGGANAGQ